MKDIPSVFRYIKFVLYVSIFIFIPLLSSTALSLSSSRQRQFALQADIFTGIRYSAFHYSGRYFNPDNTKTDSSVYQNIESDTSKDVFIAGGALNIIKKMSNKYDFGLSLVGTGVSSKAELENNINEYSGGISTLNLFSIDYQFDVALMFGINLISQTFIYAKIGPSYTRVNHTQEIITIVDGNESESYFSNNSKKLGGMFALGLKYFFNKRIGIFAEYDYHYYRKITLPTIDPVDLNFVDIGSNTLTHSVKPNFGSLHFGVTVNIF